MIMTRAFVLASLLSATLAVSAIGQTLPPGMTMHRLQAGEPDASGWMLAASTEGGVSVRLPLKFNDLPNAQADSQSPTALFFVVGDQSLEGVKFTAPPIVYRNGARSSEHYFCRV